MRPLVLAVLAAAVTAAPADAAVTWSDPCGDAAALVRAVGTDVVEARTPRNARHDVREAQVAAAPGGVDVQLRVCGPIPAPERLTSGWQVSAELGGGCGVSAFLGDAAGTGARTARWIGRCTRPSALGGTETYAVWDRELPATAWTVAGDTITWRLRADDLPEREAAPLLPGTGWTGLRTHSIDGARGTEASYDDLVAANGPGARDESATAEPFTTE